MNDHRYAVIMAGGSGTRLWPLSRQNRPKQLLHFSDPRSLFQLAVDRLEGLIPRERIFVVTVCDQAELLKQNVPSIPAENYLIEPMPRGTASVVGLAAVALNQLDPQASMAVLTADHLIENETYFRSLLNSAFEVAQEDHLVTLGIHPSAPVTGYGYIQRGAALGNTHGNPFYEVLRFKEKPDLASAIAYVKSGDHLWNSGMFIWRVEKILAEFEKSMPALYAQLQQIAEAYGTPQRAAVLSEVWPKIKPETIDYGIMEKSSRVAVLPAENLGWSDVGSWDSLIDVLQADAQGNVLVGEAPVALDTTHSLVFSEQENRIIVTIGLEDVIVVNTLDALLICKRGDSQKVRDVVELLKKSERHQFL